jgi:2-polyprenyl-3-methyl-5-hydroxy-6-metoxy-1,4-benzoquinol methylase
MEVKTNGIYYKDCPVCSSVISFWKHKKNGSDSYKIDVCNSCGYGLINPRPTLDFLIDYYERSGHEPGKQGYTTTATLQSVSAIENKDPNSTVDAKRILKTIKSLECKQNNKQFLDVGCGYGFFSKEAIRNGFEVSAIELAEAEREITRQMTGIDPAASTFESYSAEGKSFSVILMSQILEHALDVNQWIEKANHLLEDNGLVVIAVPNFTSIFKMFLQEDEPFITPPTHLNFFSVSSLTRLLAKHNFQVEKVQYTSRLSSKALRRRVPAFGYPLMPFIKLSSTGLLKIVDAFKLGMIINIYGRKISDCKGGVYHLNKSLKDL